MKMKKFFSWTALSVLSFFAVACSVAELKQEEQPVMEERQVTLEAVAGDVVSKTVRVEDGTVLWTPQDEISVFYGSGENGGSRFVSTNTTNSRTANFTGTINVLSGTVESSESELYFWAVYPYDSTASCDGMSIATTIPARQTAVAGTFADDLFPAVGRSQGLRIAFYNICGGIKFSLTKEGVKRVRLRGNDVVNDKIAGRFGFEFGSDGRPRLLYPDTYSTEIVVTPPSGEAFVVGETYYIIMMPNSFDKGFKMIFDTDEEVGIYDRTVATTISRSSFSGLTDVDANVEYVRKNTDIIAFEDPAVKKRLVSLYDINEDGEISYYEAESVESLGSVFQFNLYPTYYKDTIRTFNELQYFTGLKTLSDYCFAYSPALESVTLPESVSSIDWGAFCGCKALKSIVIPAGVTKVGTEAFSGSGLEEITFLSTAKFDLFQSALPYNDNLKKITLYCPEPLDITMPIYGHNSGYYLTGVDIYVPAKGLSDYKEKWFSFANYIKPIPGTMDENIVFADATLKSLAVSKFDGNGDGELSYAEAALVTGADLNMVFSRKDFTSFDEFKYFIGVTELPGGCFQYCPNLTSIKFPISLTKIGTSAMEGCASLKSIECSTEMAFVGYQSFLGCTALESVILKAPSIDLVGMCFNGCPNLKLLKLYALEPPTINTARLGFDLPSTCSILIPFHMNGGSPTVKDAYLEAGWSAYADQISSMSTEDWTEHWYRYFK